MKYQLTCPKCKHEFEYDNGYLDKNITRLGIEIREIQLQLADHNLLPYDEKMRRTDWWYRAKRAVTEKQKALAELKAIRKVSDQQVTHYEYTLFKQEVKERFGEKAYKQIIDAVEEGVRAYKASGLMLHEYTRANSKSNVTSISKL